MSHPFTPGNILQNHALIYAEISGNKLHCRNRQIEAAWQKISVV